MAHWPSGSKLVMKCTTPKGVTIYTIGYKYSSKKGVMIFIFTENAGNSDDGDPYEAKYMEDGVRKVRKVPRPQVITSYFKACPIIDTINQSRQGELRLGLYEYFQGFCIPYLSYQTFYLPVFRI